MRWILLTSAMGAAGWLVWREVQIRRKVAEWQAMYGSELAARAARIAADCAERKARNAGIAGWLGKGAGAVAGIVGGPEAAKSVESNVSRVWSQTFLKVDC